MGSSSSQVAGFPELEVFFGDPHNRTRLSEIPVIHSLVLIIPDKKSILDYVPPGKDRLGLQIFVNINQDYYRELASYAQISRMVSPLFLAINNLSEITAHDLRLEIKIPGESESVVAMDGYGFPDVPKGQTNLLVNRFVGPPPQYEITVRKMGSKWLAQARINKVQPKSTFWIEAPLYLGALVSRDVELDIAVFGDNLPEPHHEKLIVRIEAEKRQVDLKGIVSLERERTLANI